MPKMNGFDFCLKVLEQDVNPRFCFMSSGLINQEALREQYSSLSIGCFIKKPVTIENLVRRVKAVGLDWTGWTGLSRNLLL